MFGRILRRVHRLRRLQSRLRRRILRRRLRPRPTRRSGPASAPGTSENPAPLSPAFSDTQSWPVTAAIGPVPNIHPIVGSFSNADRPSGLVTRNTGNGVGTHCPLPCSSVPWKCQLAGIVTVTAVILFSEGSTIFCLLLPCAAVATRARDERHPLLPLRHSFPTCTQTRPAPLPHPSPASLSSSHGRSPIA